MRRRLFLAIGILALCLPLTLAGSSAYFPHALGDFDGTNDYLQRGSDLVGNADGPYGIISCWFRVDGGDGAARDILDHAIQGRVYLRLTSSNKFEVRMRTSAGANVLRLTTTPTYLADSSWRHIVAAWDSTIPKGLIYVDDAAPGLDTNIVAAGNVDYTLPEWNIAQFSSGVNRWNGALAELYFNVAEYLDISVEANRRLFIDRSGNPVPLGIDGSFPTGTAPIIYMRERVNNGGLNSGTGGDFTINGSPGFSEGPVPFFPLSTWTPGRGMSSGMRIH